jgi:hypothetical protein
VRSARQQDFLRQAKDQVGVGEIVSDRRKLTKIFGKYTSSDIRSRKSVLRLLRLVAASAQNPIVEIHFKGRVGASYVTASPPRIRKMVTQFLGTRASKGPRGPVGPKRTRKEAAKLSPASSAGKDQASQVVAAGLTGLPVYYPTMTTAGASYAGPPRAYSIRVGRRVYRSYRIVVNRGALGEYYGLQGTQWHDPPILKDPDEKKKIGKREYEIFTDGDRVRLVAWHTDQGSYWVANTLLQTLSKKQMLDIASTAKTL